MDGEKKNDFAKGSVAYNILKLALPMTFAQLINVLYNVVDRMYIGRIPGHGGLALTGVGLCFPVIMMINAFANLCGVGGAPLCSIARGKNDEARAELILGNAFLMLIAFGIAITAAVYAFKRPLLYAIGASSSTFGFADDYLSVYLSGSLAVMIGLGMNSFINSQGFGSTGMLTVLLGAVINIALDPVFIFALDLGVKGAAIATVIAQTASAAWVMCFLTGKKTILKLKVRNMRFNPSIAFETLALGLTGFTMQVTNSAVGIMCNSALQVWGGDIYVGVMTVINSIREMCMLPVSGVSNGCQPVLGYNYGAGEFERVRQGFKFVTAICIAYSFAAWAFIMLFPQFFVRLFNDGAELMEKGVPGIRQYFAAFFMMSLQMSGQAGFVSLGKAKQAVFFSILRKGIVVIPLVLLLPGLGLGVNGVFLSEPISDVIGGSACFITFMLTVWPELKKLDKAAA